MPTTDPTAPGRPNAILATTRVTYWIPHQTSLIVLPLPVDETLRLIAGDGTDIRQDITSLKVLLDVSALYLFRVVFFATLFTDHEHHGGLFRQLMWPLYINWAQRSTPERVDVCHRIIRDGDTIYHRGVTILLHVLGKLCYIPKGEIGVDTISILVETRDTGTNHIHCCRVSVS